MRLTADMQDTFFPLQRGEDDLMVDRMQRFATGLTILAAVALGFIAVPQAQAVDSTSVGTGSWQAGTTWNTNPTFPNGAADTATVGGWGSDHTVTLNADVTLSALTMGGNSDIDLNGNNLSVSGSATFGSWGSGSIVGSGNFVVGGAFSIGDGPGTVTLDAGDSVNSLAVGGTATVTVQADGVVSTDVSSDNAGSFVILQSDLHTTGNWRASGGGGTIDVNNNEAEGNDLSFTSWGAGTVIGNAGSSLVFNNINMGFEGVPGVLLADQDTLGDTTGMSIEATINWNGGDDRGQLQAIFDANTTGADIEGQGANFANFDWALRWLGDREAELEAHLGIDFLVTSPIAFTANNIEFANDGWTYVGYLSAAEPVPEPATLALFAIGGGLLMGIAIQRRRARRGASPPAMSD